MASSRATTVEAYLAELPPERRAVVSAVRNVIRKHLPKGYDEVMRWGMITYEVPLSRYPDTYNKAPLSYVSLAAQKQYYSVYLMGTYMSPTQLEELEASFARAGKKLDMGKSCVRFKRLEDLPLDVIGNAVAGMTPDEFIARYEASRRA